MSTNERGRNHLAQGPNASQPAQLPGIPALPLSVDPSIRRFLEAVKEHLEVRAGARGNPYEQVVTKRDLLAAGLSVNASLSGQRGGGVGSSLMMQRPDGSYAAMTVDEFAAELFNSKLYKDLITRLDDPSRFDNFPQEVRDALANSIAAEAAARGADIRSTETKLQTDMRSLAMKVDEVTAAIEQSSAGVRELTFASAEANRAQAGKVTQIEARLDDVGGVTIEQAITATADRTAGLAGEYTLKINAGKAVAGFGLAASEDPSGATESSFVVQADTFAVVPTYTFVSLAASVPTATAIGQTWYQTDTKVSKIATATGTGSWAAYPAKVPFAINTATGKIYIRSDVEIDGNLLVSGSVQAAHLAADSIDGKTITGALLRTSASTGVARFNINADGIMGYDAGNVLRADIDPAIGYAYFKNSGSTSAVIANNTSAVGLPGAAVSGFGNAGAGVRGFSVSQVGVEGKSENYFGGAFYGGFGGANCAPLFLNPVPSLPTVGAIHGAMCAYDGQLYFHNGTTWKQVSLV